MTLILRDFEAGGMIETLRGKIVIRRRVDLDPSSILFPQSILRRRKKTKRNMRVADRAIRIALGAVVAVLCFASQLSLAAAVILGIRAVAFPVTGIVGVYPLYIPFGISTKRRSAA